MQTVKYSIRSDKCIEFRFRHVITKSQVIIDREGGLLTAYHGNLNLPTHPIFGTSDLDDAEVKDFGLNRLRPNIFDIPTTLPLCSVLAPERLTVGITSYIYQLTMAAPLSRVDSYQYPSAHLGHLNEGQQSNLEEFKRISKERGYFQTAGEDGRAEPSHDDETML